MYADKPGQVALQEDDSRVTIVGRAMFSDEDTQTEETFEACLFAAQKGNSGAQFRLAQYYLQGELVTKHCRDSFKWLLEAACGAEKQAYRELSHYFQIGCGTKKNLHEAYIWALISNTTQKFKVPKERLKTLEDALPQTEREEAEDETSRRAKLLKKNEYSAADFRPFVMKPKEQAKADAEPLLAEEEAEPSTSLEYSSLTKVRKSFDLAKVEIVLVIGRKLAKAECLDFTKLKIKYEGKATDTKNASIYQKDCRVNSATRHLLVCLACQASVADPDKRAANIRDILTPASADSVSHLNAMLKAMFPNCALGKSAMINKGKGLVNIGLSISDRANILGTCSCRECSYFQ